MQESNIVVLETYDAMRKSAIRRRPSTSDGRLAAAIHALHERGPSLVCELWEEIDTLEAQLGSSEASSKRGSAAREAKELVDRLRGL